MILADELQAQRHHAAHDGVSEEAGVSVRQRQRLLSRYVS
jgi:hypothetical protein